MEKTSLVDTLMVFNSNYKVFVLLFTVKSLLTSWNTCFTITSFPYSWRLCQVWVPVCLCNDNDGLGLGRLQGRLWKGRAMAVRQGRSEVGNGLHDQGIICIDNSTLLTFSRSRNYKSIIFYRVILNLMYSTFKWVMVRLTTTTGDDLKTGLIIILVHSFEPPLTNQV